MKVDVKYYADEQPITVQHGYTLDGEFIVESCNHAGAIDKTYSSMSYSLYDEDITEWSESMPVCDKCDELLEDFCD